MDPILFIVIISVLGPIIGSIIGVLRKPSLMYMCNMLCFAAGVMLGISFLELIPESIHISSVGVCVGGLIMRVVEVRVATEHWLPCQALPRFGNVCQ